MCNIILVFLNIFSDCRIHGSFLSKISNNYSKIYSLYYYIINFMNNLFDTLSVSKKNTLQCEIFRGLNKVY